MVKRSDLESSKVWEEPFQLRSWKPMPTEMHWRQLLALLLEAGSCRMKHFLEHLERSLGNLLEAEFLKGVS
jgi:hypothetical protein